jgi:hypothetical protein
MKCIHCGVDSKYKDRQNGKCSHCHKRFAFEPKKGDPLTDGAFKAAIDAVSANGKVKWGVEHLYWEVRRRRTRSPFARLFRWLSDKVSGPSTLGPNNDPEFDSLWQRWVGAHGQPQGLIVRKEQPKQRKAQEPDIADYSFDRAVICDRPRTVDLLVANNFHFENNCAVLSIGGYPQGPFETIRTMLKRNPKLQVFALHDADVAGCRLAHRLANDPNWFKGQASVTDVALRPRHATPYRRLLLSVPKTLVSAGEGIDADEVAFLSSTALELAVVRPEQVLKRLFRAINRQEGTATATPSGGSDSDGHSSFSSDADDADGGADSFG